MTTPKEKDILRLRGGSGITSPMQLMPCPPCQTVGYQCQPLAVCLPQCTTACPPVIIFNTPCCLPNICEPTAGFQPQSAIPPNYNNVTRQSVSQQPHLNVPTSYQSQASPQGVHHRSSFHIYEDSKDSRHIKVEPSNNAGLAISGAHSVLEAVPPDHQTTPPDDHPPQRNVPLIRIDSPHDYHGSRSASSFRSPGPPQYQSSAKRDNQFLLPPRVKQGSTFRSLLRDSSSGGTSASSPGCVGNIQSGAAHQQYLVPGGINQGSAFGSLLQNSSSTKQSHQSGRTSTPLPGCVGNFQRGAAQQQFLVPGGINQGSAFGSLLQNSSSAKQSHQSGGTSSSQQGDVGNFQRSGAVHQQFVDYHSPLQNERQAVLPQAPQRLAPFIDIQTPESYASSGSSTQYQGIPGQANQFVSPAGTGAVHQQSVDYRTPVQDDNPAFVPQAPRRNVPVLEYQNSMLPQSPQHLDSPLVLLSSMEQDKKRTVSELMNNLSQIEEQEISQLKKLKDYQRQRRHDVFEQLRK